MFKCIVILGLMASIAAGVAPAQASRQTLSVSCQVQTTFSSAILDCTSSRPVPLMFNYGDKQPLEEWRHAGSGTAHRLKLNPLLPTASIRYAALGRVNGVWKVLQTGKFRANNPESTANSISRDGTIMLGDSPFFMVFGMTSGCPYPGLYPPVPQVDQYLAMGDSVLMGAGWWCGYQNPPLATDRIDEMCAHKCWWLEEDPQNSQGIDPPEKLSFNADQTRNPDVVIWPNGHLMDCGQSGSSAAGLPNELHQQEEANPSKPVVVLNYLWKETPTGHRSCLKEPKKLAALVAIEACSGVQGIGYDTFIHNNKGEDISASPKMQAEAGRQKGWLATSLPTLYAPQVAVSRGTAKLVACAHRSHGVTTVTTVNATDKPLTTSVVIAGAGTRLALRYKEDAVVKLDSVKVVRGRISGFWPAYAKRKFVLR